MGPAKSRVERGLCARWKTRDLPTDIGQVLNRYVMQRFVHSLHPAHFPANALAQARSAPCVPQDAVDLAPKAGAAHP
jgi:hypothetical protein